MADSLPNQSQGSAPPLVTVAIPVYNAGKYLRLAVLSIIRQTFTNWEMLIIDDGSTDTALQDIGDIDDTRIRIFRDGKNRGLAARLNEAADMARGQYLARMDQDDVSYPERFERQIAAMQNDPKLDLVATRAITINENDQATGLFPYAITHDEICAHPWRGFYLPHPTWMGRIEWFRKHRYTVPDPYFCEDQELLLRSYRDSRFATLDEIQFAYRIRSKINWQKRVKTRSAFFRIQLRHFMEGYQWGSLFMLVLTFLSRLAWDLLKFTGQSFFQDQPKIVPASILSQWRVVLCGLVEEQK